MRPLNEVAPVGFGKGKIQIYIIRMKVIRADVLHLNLVDSSYTKTGEYMNIFCLNYWDMKANLSDIYRKRYISEP